MSRLSKQEMFCYWRMGLVTGILDRQAAIAWADREILSTQIPDQDLIELSLAGRMTYSQMIYLLNRLQGAPACDRPLKALLAEAGRLLEAEPGRALEIARGLRLINSEEYLPGEARGQLAELEACLGQFLEGRLPEAEFIRVLGEWLSIYWPYQIPPR